MGFRLILQRLYKVENEMMLKFIQELKSSSAYQDNFCENTKLDFDLYEKALSGDTEAFTSLNIYR